MYYETVHGLDHLLWEEYRLEEGEARFSALSGVEPAFGGRHPELGTHNSLLSLGGGAYLEIIAPDLEHPKMAHLPGDIPADFEPGLFAFVLRSYDLALTETLIKRAGLRIEGSLGVARQTPGGEHLAWQTLVAGGHDFGPFVPAFTSFEGKTHPSAAAPQGCELVEFSVRHPESERLVRLYKKLQIKVPVFPAHKARMRAVVSTPRGEIVLNSRRPKP